MRQLKRRLKTFRFYFLGFFPRRLPTGLHEFNLFCTQLFDAYNLPHLPSYKHAVASMVMHLGPTTSHKAPFYFAKSVRKAMANQVAYEAMQQIKQEEDKKITNQGEVTPERASLDESVRQPKVQEAAKPVVPKAKKRGV